MTANLTGRTRPAEAHRLDHLDSLRGIAALSVVACHFVIAFGLPAWPWLFTKTPLHLCWDGPAAVSFFFVLSGLVLSLRHFRTSSSPNLESFQFGPYTIARICRIWLPYLIVLALSALAYRFAANGMTTDPAGSAVFAGLWREEPTLRSLLRQAFDVRLASPLTGPQVLVPQAWSLTVELVMSLLLPLAVLAAGRSTAWFVACAFLATHLARVNGYFVHFAVGIALAKHFRDVVSWLEPRASARILLALLGAFFASYDSLEWRVEPLQSLALGSDLQAIGSALLIAVASASPGVRSWLSRGLIHRIGKTSFSLYLIHMLILVCVTPRVMSAMLGAPAWLTWSAGLSFTLLASLLLSEPLYRFVETPTMSLGKALGALVDLRGDGRLIRTASTVAGAHLPSSAGG